MTCSLGIDELLRFGEEHADDTHADGEASCFVISVCWCGGEAIRYAPAIQKTVFHVSTAPPTPRLAHAASTYPRE